MIHWFWLIPTMIFGAIVGMFATALMVAGAEEDRRCWPDNDDYEED